MVKKTFLALMVVLMATSLVPSEGMCWYGHHGRHGYHHNDALLWGLGGLVLGTTLVAATYQPPPRVVYGAPLPPVYAYAPTNLPPGMCRWERYVLDGYGRTLLDQRGQPVREYTVGSCQYPPN